MKSPLKGIGFSKIEKESVLTKILKDTLNEPTEQVSEVLDKEYLLVEYLKCVSERTYVAVRAKYKENETTKNISVQSCKGYVKSAFDIDVIDVEIDCMEDEVIYYGICEEKESGIEIVFWLQNVCEYLKQSKNYRKCTKINIVGLASEGTIILPIYKDEEDIILEEEEREKLREIIELAKSGDEYSQEILEEEEKELDKLLKERLCEEDFLSIMSEYFIPETMIEATYAILGQITKIQERINSLTKEEMYLFTVSVNGMLLEVAIDKLELIGVPSIGMRFMGTVWIQGTAIMT